MLCLVVLIACAYIAQAVDDRPRPAPEPRCEYLDGDLRVSIVVSSVKECDRIKSARRRWIE